MHLFLENWLLDTLILSRAADLFNPELTSCTTVSYSAIVPSREKIRLVLRRGGGWTGTVGGEGRRGREVVPGRRWVMGGDGRFGRIEGVE